MTIARYKDPSNIEFESMPSRTQIPISEGGEFNSHYPEDVGFKNKVLNKNFPHAESFNDFRPPCLQKITSKMADGSTTILALYATPTTPGYCKHIGAQVVIPPAEKPKGSKTALIGLLAFPMPFWFQHILASVFLVSGRSAYDSYC
jgi:hypothetical protein